ncbi:hypothetical protein GR925_10335 [Streptomyces sp. HUCO-GS316]|uniref:VOC family protein n=1 Tax=Streptomyces sp. HUCO-GS316 TaxID=2692198 RepID=UPI001371568C|nr:VOC family protein [Streptomyces sp. HUCO-GS316]MXM63838.1 hypothetical protein [Streptomyces sp. HUCO-GS316]
MSLDAKMITIDCAERSTEVDRLVELGASVVGEHSAGPLIWTVLREPEGNEFCVAG